MTGPAPESEPAGDPATVRAQARLSPVAAVLVAVGSLGAFAAMTIDGIAVIGRHANIPLTGSIEMSQVAVVLVAACAIAFATLQRAHAAVDLLHRKLGPKGRAVIVRLAAFAGFVFMALVVAGSCWVAADLWRGAERTELMEIPLMPLRMVWIACAVIAALGFLVQAVRPDVSGAAETGGH